MSLQDGAIVRSVLGEQAIGVLDGGMGGGDLGGMDGAGEQDDGLAFGDQLLGLGRSGFARIGQALLDGDVAVEVLESLGVGNGGRDERPVVGGLAEFVDANFVAGFGEELEVADHFVPVEDGFVGSDLVAEVALGRGDGGVGRAGQKEDRKMAGSHLHILSWGGIGFVPQDSCGRSWGRIGFVPQILVGGLGGELGLFRRIFARLRMVKVVHGVAGTRVRPSQL